MAPWVLTSKKLITYTASVSVLVLIGCSGGYTENTISIDTNSTNESQNTNPESASQTDNSNQTDNSENAIPLAQNPSLDNLYDYTNQLIPSYITKDNTAGNSISNAGATLGRVLFYDKRLSNDNSTSCASCHQQASGFSDTAIVSTGVNGATARHSMRLVNTRFADENKFFWDERAATLELQTTQPIRDHAEMGFSGTAGDPQFDALLTKLTATEYYPALFVAAFGNELVTENGIQRALAQFIRSIRSFDSRFDEGRVSSTNNAAAFGNFTQQENEGKRLFLQPPNFNNGTRTAGSGLGCNGCHRAPEFDIDPNTRNNGVISTAQNIAATDTTNTRSPSLRDTFRPDGTNNGPFMHSGELTTMNEVLDHYNNIVVDRALNPNIDNRLLGNQPGPNRPQQNNATGQNLNLLDSERAAVIAFLKTLSGNALYTDPRWSNPFDAQGNLLNALSQ